MNYLAISCIRVNKLRIIILHDQLAAFSHHDSNRSVGNTQTSGDESHCIMIERYGYRRDEVRLQ